MNMPLFLFCGGTSVYGKNIPKPLMKVRDGKTLLVYFLNHIQRYRTSMPSNITLLCDTGQEEAFTAELSNFIYPIPISIQACGRQTTTFEKLIFALRKNNGHRAPIQFGYPDIFLFEEFTGPPIEALMSESSIHISAAPLTSRFPRLIIDVYSNKINGISNYQSPVPANPMFVFGGDMWGRADQILELSETFLAQTSKDSPTLEYDFYFWLINLKKINCQQLHGERLWIDSNRDINLLLARTEEIT